MPFVLDASSTLPWCFRDESSEFTEQLLNRAIAMERIYVPANWPMEVLQGLTRAVRAGRLPDADSSAFMTTLASFNIAVDVRPAIVQWAAAVPMITTYRLSAYDAGYLALAKELRIPLATMDDRLQAAARAEGLLLEPSHGVT